MLIAKTAPSIAKILPACGPSYEYSRASALRGEKFSFQLCLTSDGDTENRTYYKLAVNGSPAPVKLFEVGCVGVGYPCYPDCDDDYITKQPAVLPDLLTPLENAEVAVVKGVWRSVWICVDLTEAKPEGGLYPITLTLEGAQTQALTFSLTVIPCELAPQQLIYTQWFHSDCLATRYGVEVFSERHWQLIESYMRFAAEFGQNMILTPLFTPALDTYIGGERPTVQLVGVKTGGGEYSFDFTLLDRWIETAKRCGMKYFEMSHLFTQWGAVNAPKIMAQTPGGYRRIFGWETDARGEEYKAFLRCFLTALRAHLEAGGVWSCCRFHVSDEPNPDCIDNYRDAAAVIRSVIPGDMITDALSHTEYYDEGLLEHPIPASDCIDGFLERNIPNLWTYYCCGQSKYVSNRFIAMQGRRTRIIGAQFYKFDIAGFLQWGYNFWYGHLSKKEIDPYLTADGDGTFPAGDPFTVYPGKNGPLSSVRQYLFYEALCDLRAMKTLEGFVGRQEVLDLIERDIPPITFSQYPRTDDFLLGMRGRINARIASEMSERRTEK